MERFQTLQRLRTRLRVITGQSDDNSMSGQTFDRHNEYCNLAHEEVMTLRQWGTTESEYTFQIGVDQRFIDYPPNCRGENVLELAIWSNGTDTTTGLYLPLRKRPIPIYLDTDPISDAGGEPAAAMRSMPTRYQLRNQIETWPRADQIYLAKMRYTVNPELLADDDQTVVDAVAVLHLAAAYEYVHLGESDVADKHRVLGLKRANIINAWQHNGEVVQMDDQASMDDIEWTRIDPVLIIDQRRPG